MKLLFCRMRTRHASVCRVCSTSAGIGRAVLVLSDCSSERMSAALQPPASPAASPPPASSSCSGS